jgi:N-acetyl-gamma-glutamyl-phosphate reductase
MAAFAVLQLGAPAASVASAVAPVSRQAHAAPSRAAPAAGGASSAPVFAAVAAAGLLAGSGATRGRHGRRAAIRTALRVKKVFIDGEAGTTGLQVYERLQAHPEIEILSLPPDQRKDSEARKKALREADAAVLCLPDDAAKAAVELCGDADTIIVDASTAHRTNDDWTYGFAEMSAEQREALKKSKRISNPGCYPTGFIGLMKPLVDAGIVPSETLINIHAVSGYSGGGKALIEIYEKGDAEPWGAYGFNLAHKHTPEMAKWTGLETEPIFCPSVGNFAQGMVVSVPLRQAQLKSGTTAADIHDTLAKHYEGSKFVSVMPLNDSEHLERGAFLRPDVLNNTNSLQLFVYGNEAKGTYWLAARLDNLGKGASGAAVQNLNIALGFDEDLGLSV